MREKNVGGFLGETFDLIGANIRYVLLYVLILGGMSAAGMMLGLIDETDSIAGIGMDLEVTAAMGFVAALYQIAVAVLTVIGSYFLIHLILKDSGRLHGEGTRIWAYIGMSILAFLGMFVGFMLLVIPGIIVMMRWSASSGFLIGAREGVVESLSASWDATRGYGWQIFFAGLVLLIGLIIISGITVGGSGFSGLEPLIAITASLVDSASNALFICFGLAVYMLVHDDSDETAEVFS